MIAAIFGQFIDYWRVFVLCESILILILYGKLLYDRFRLFLKLETLSARRLIFGAVAKHFAIVMLVGNVALRSIENWGHTAASSFGFMIQLAYISLLISYSLYERRQVIIRKDAGVV